MTVSINAKIAGTGSKTSIGAFEIGSSSSDEIILSYVPFSGAVTESLVWVGPGKVMQVVVTTGAVGTIDLEDSAVSGLGSAIGSQLVTTTSPTTFLFNSGLGTNFFTGILLTITGANTGYIVVQEYS